MPAAAEALGVSAELRHVTKGFRPGQNDRGDQEDSVCPLSGDEKKKERERSDPLWKGSEKTTVINRINRVTGYKGLAGLPKREE